MRGFIAIVIMLLALTSCTRGIIPPVNSPEYTTPMLSPETETPVNTLFTTNTGITPSPPNRPEENVLLNEFTNSDAYQVYLGMKRLDLDLEALDPDAAYIGGTDYENEKTGVLYLTGESDHFGFTAEASNDEICQFSCTSDQYTTSLGLRVGDTKERLILLYGENTIQTYTIWERYTCFEYKTGKNYFTVLIENGYVWRWEVCKYSYGKW